jgi:hypothetical protein
LLPVTSEYNSIAKKHNISGIWSEVILKDKNDAMKLSTNNLTFGYKNVLRISYFFPQQQAPSQIIFNHIFEPNLACATEILF